jgi:hypothetical protein
MEHSALPAAAVEAKGPFPENGSPVRATGQMTGGVLEADADGRDCLHHWSRKKK